MSVLYGLDLISISEKIVWLWYTGGKLLKEILAEVKDTNKDLRKKMFQLEKKVSELQEEPSHTKKKVKVLPSREVRVSCYETKVKVNMLLELLRKYTHLEFYTGCSSKSISVSLREWWKFWMEAWVSDNLSMMTLMNIMHSEAFSTAANKEILQQLVAECKVYLPQSSAMIKGYCVDSNTPCTFTMLLHLSL